METSFHFAVSLNRDAVKHFVLFLLCKSHLPVAGLLSYDKRTQFLCLLYGADVVLSSRYHERFACPKVIVWGSYSLACGYHKEQRYSWVPVQEATRCKTGCGAQHPLLLWSIRAQIWFPGPTKGISGCSGVYALAAFPLKRGGQEVFGLCCFKTLVLIVAVFRNRTADHWNKYVWF